MSNENVKTATTYSFRNKFEKLLTAENKEPIVAAFNTFCSMNPAAALDYLWHLTYDIAKIPEILDQLGLNMGIISPENVLPFRNELRVQYLNSHPGFLNTEVIGEAKAQAFMELLDKTDSITANVVFQHCRSQLQRSSEEIERILFLLKDVKDSNGFGGIRSLYFNAKEASYLKAFRPEIYNLFNAMYEYEQESFAASKPFAKLGELIEEAGFTVPEVPEEPAKEEEDTEECYFDAKAEIKEVLAEVQNDGREVVEQESAIYFWPITPEAIIFNEVVFTAFIEKGDRDTLSQIKKLGYDLNEVMAKEELIKNFLEATKALRK